MLDQTKNVLIGLFILTALGIMVYIILFLHPSMGNEEEVLQVRFANIDKVNVGTRVLYAGRPVGEVVGIQVVPDARLDKELHDGEIYIYELTLKIDSGIDVFTSDEIMAKTAGLLGEKSVSITPRPPAPGEPLVKVSNQVIYAASPPSVEDAIREFSSLAHKVQTTFEKVNLQLDLLREKQFWENLSVTAKNINEISTSVNKPEELQAIIKDTKHFADGLVQLIDKANQSWPKIDQALEKVDASVVNFLEMTNKAKGGEGTIGRLIAKDDLYLRLTSVMSKAETILDDITHFGLLYQTDKTWQRLRARRANLLLRLSSPQEFQNFFNDEVDQISASLSRVSMVLEDTSQCNYLPVVCSPDFIKVFADLLRRVSGLEDNLKLFDQQVVEIREKECCYPIPKSEKSDQCLSVDVNQK